MLRLLLILGGAAVIVLLLVPYLDGLDEPRSRDYVTEKVMEAPPVTITMLCSDEKEEWIRKASSDFMRRRPDINLKVKVMSSVEGVNALLARRETPTMWSPAETGMLQFLQYRWRKEFGTAPFEVSGEDAPQSLASSPVVWLSWRRRVEAINAAIEDGKLSPDAVWSELGCPGVPLDPESDGKWSPVPARWDAVEAFKPAPAPAAAPRAPGAPAPARKTPPLPSPEVLSSWGEIKLAHADPTHSNSGFYAIYLMAYQFHGQPADVSKAMLDRDPFNTWFRRCQRIRKGFLESARSLTNRLYQLGPKTYDIVVTYENLALQAVNGAGESNTWDDQMYLYYPPTTVLADHPIVILNADGMPEDQRKAARDWISYLLSPKVQRSLIMFGLRPISGDKLDARQDDNPFTEAGRSGVQFAPVVKSPPILSGEAADRLTEIWRQATGYY